MSWRRMRTVAGMFALAALAIVLAGTVGCEEEEISDSGTMHSEGGFTGDGYEEWYLGGNTLRIADGTLTFRDFTYDVSDADTVDGRWEGTDVWIWVDGELVYES